MRLKQIILAILSCLCLTGVAGENVNFLAKPLTAGKASLTEHGYQVCRTLGSANFSPELRYPFQLIYNSAREENGIFGFAWYAPQLESTAYYDKDGILWITPWGEKIKFLARTQSEDNKSSFYSPFADWKVTNTTPKNAIKQSGDWTFDGKYDYDGWQFVYTDGRLQSIRSAAGNELNFSYSDNKLQEISQNGKAFVAFSYSGNQVVEMTLNGVEYHFTYADTMLTILPKIPDGNIIHANRNMLSAIQTGSLNPVDFSYDDYGFLAQITQGDMIDSLTVEHQTEAERQEQLLAQNGTQKYSGPINGRITADALYGYRYPSSEPGKVTLIDGQIANARYGDKSEDFIWDGLALIHRNENSYINEPYITGENPVLSTQDGVMFNDTLGNTLGIKSENGFTPVQMSAFGETSHKNAMFTGKPYIGELGYAFLFRNYRPEQGKWQTSDPLGYPDGWNNFAYCNNGVINAVDLWGLVKHTYNPSNVTYGTPEICSISYNTPYGGTGGYVYVDGIKVTVSARRLVTYEVICGAHCEMDGTTRTTYAYTTKSAFVPDTLGETVPDLPTPMGFNPISIPENLSQAALEALRDVIIDTLIDAAFSTNFSDDTQRKINNTISNLINSNGGWSQQPIDFGECTE